MHFDLVSFLLGGFSFVFVFLAVMAYFVKDEPAKKAMAWIAERKNFANVNLVVGGILILFFVVMGVVGVIKLLHQIHLAPELYYVLYAGAALMVSGGIALLFSLNRRRNHAPVVTTAQPAAQTTTTSAIGRP